MRTPVVAAFLAVAVALAGSSAVAMAGGGGADAGAHHGTVIRYLSTQPTNTDLDLGKPGLSAGDVQVFLNKATRDGRQIGYEVGECRVVEVTKRTLKGSCHGTVVLDDGTITTQGVFAEVFADGPGTLSMAVTGGTGRYAGASGEMTGVFVAGTDDVRTTIRLD